MASTRALAALLLATWTASLLVQQTLAGEPALLFLFVPMSVGTTLQLFLSFGKLARTFSCQHFRPNVVEARACSGETNERVLLSPFFVVPVHRIFSSSGTVLVPE